MRTLFLTDIEAIRLRMLLISSMNAHQMDKFLKTYQSILKTLDASLNDPEESDKKE